jgi:N-carbamoyl-L-amino-acid hydrolase
VRAFTNRIAVVTASLIFFLPPLVRAQDNSSRHVNQDRLWQTLQKLGEFGKNPEGGVSRIGFTEADLAGRSYVIGLMKDAGLDVRIDPAGNIFGHRAGSENLPVLLLGSHIDSVPHGGNFDGDVGSLGALEVIRALNDQKEKTRHPLEVVIWTNEEGGRFRTGWFVRCRRTSPRRHRITPR